MFKQKANYRIIQCNFCDDSELVNEMEAKITYLRAKPKLNDEFRGAIGEYPQTFICHKCVKDAIKLLKDGGIL
jgi:hypothetical protein